MPAGHGTAAAAPASALPTLVALAAAYRVLFLFLAALLAAALLCFTRGEDPRTPGRAVPEDGRLA